ncbi:MAG: Na+/H+ antiporter subunit E [Kiritimatiellia bacterium]
MKRFRVSLFILLAWLLLSWDISTPSVVLGMVVGGMGAVLLWRVFASDQCTMLVKPHAGFAASKLLLRLWYLLLFIPVFIGKVLASGAHIARLALAPSMDFWPGIVRIRGGLPSLDHTTLLAGLITLTPGTLTIDYDEQGDDLYVHWIDVTAYGDIEMDDKVISGLRRWVGRLLG